MTLNELAAEREALIRLRVRAFIDAANPPRSPGESRRATDPPSVAVSAGEQVGLATATTSATSEQSDEA